MELKEIMMTESSKSSVIAEMDSKGWVFVTEKISKTGDVVGVFKPKETNKKLIFD